MPGSVWEHLESVVAASRAAVPAHMDAVPAHRTAGRWESDSGQAYPLLRRAAAAWGPSVFDYV